MLVLTRYRDRGRAQQTVDIDIPAGFAGRISVVVVDIEGHRVRLGIEAPSSVKVNRRELSKPCTPPTNSGS